MIKVDSLYKRVNGTEIIKNVSFEFPAGKVLGIIGESGSGKTSLLLSLSGLTYFTSGKITVNSLTFTGESNGRDKDFIWEFRKQSGIVFQHLYLFPHLTVLGNIIEAPLHVLKEERGLAEARAVELLKKVGLENSKDKYPDELSGGEQQRVAICRALIMNPVVLLLDEPTSALDPQRSADVRTLLNDYVKQGHTLVIVSHSINFLRGLADYLLYMDEGEAVEFGETPEVLSNPRDSRTHEFLSHF
ncbi:MAG: amino acid ABC transporter ATP-binding protein [Ignavibacteriaceae bacterium]|nr:amino acid ABC transporter ATP-binding protein [Ignavibacteriaceae bacterium]